MINEHSTYYKDAKLSIVFKFESKLLRSGFVVSKRYLYDKLYIISNNISLITPIKLL